VTDGEEKDTTRRQFLTTAVAGGAAVVVGALGGSAIGSTTARAEYEIELAKLRALLAMYEQLEKVGIDAIVATGMNVVRGALDVVKAGVRLLRDGVTAVETALKNFQATLDGLRGTVNGAGQVLDDLLKKFRAAEGLVIAVLGTALPLAEAIGGFFSSLLSKIPFVGEDIRRAATALIDLVRAIPATIETLTNQLLKQLRDFFFPPSGTAPVQTNLFDPITKNLLAPLKKTLDDIDTLLTRWENDFTAPVQKALTQRQEIRKQIADYKKQIGMV
jgi:hypothetical protein